MKRAKKALSGDKAPASTSALRRLMLTLPCRTAIGPYSCPSSSDTPELWNQARRSTHEEADRDARRSVARSQDACLAETDNKRRPCADCSHSHAIAAADSDAEPTRRADTADHSDDRRWPAAIVRGHSRQARNQDNYSCSPRCSSGLCVRTRDR